MYLPSLYISVLYTSPGPHFLIPLFDLSHQLFTHPIQVKILLDSGLLALQFLPQGDGHDPHPRRSERFLLKSFDSRIPMGGTGKNLPETKKNNIFPIPKYFWRFFVFPFGGICMDMLVALRVPTFTIKVNHSCRPVYITSPMDLSLPEEMIFQRKWVKHRRQWLGVMWSGTKKIVRKMTQREFPGKKNLGKKCVCLFSFEKQRVHVCFFLLGVIVELMEI